MDERYLTELIELFQQLPEPVLDRLISIIDANLNHRQLVNIIQTEFASSASTKRLIRLLETCQLDPHGIALVIKSLHLYQDLIPPKKISLVWSGPNLSGVPMRMTAQVIMEMIDDAQKSLFLSSFTFYKVGEIVDRLDAAARRGVEISLLLETPQSSHYKVRVDPLENINEDLKNKLHLYIWPYKKRIIDGDPQTGSLHAKFILQDKAKLFISSANLTQSAMDRNIELGVIIEDRNVIQKMSEHLSILISENLITRI